MSTVYLDDSILTGIANSIRTKLGSQDTFYPNQMSSAIDSISGGSVSKVDSFSWTDYFSIDTEQKTLDVNVGFRPKQLVILTINNSRAGLLIIYDERFSTTKFVGGYNHNSYNEFALNLTPASPSYRNYLFSINNQGFTVYGGNSTTTGYYFAIG